jgi:hypothetical protein
MTYKVTFYIDADEEPDIYREVDGMGGYDLTFDEVEPKPDKAAGKRKLKPKKR